MNAEFVNRQFQDSLLVSLEALELAYKIACQTPDFRLNISPHLYEAIKSTQIAITRLVAYHEEWR